MPILHILLHAIVPLAIAILAVKTAKTQYTLWVTFALMFGTMLVDIDHLLADPIYDPQRCSIGFHPLHSLPLIAVYLLVSLWPWPAKTQFIRWLGIGLMIHMLLDSIDCKLNVGHWFTV